MDDDDDDDNDERRPPEGRIGRSRVSKVCMVRHNSIAEQCDENTRNRSRRRLGSGVGTYLYSTFFTYVELRGSHQ